MAKTLEYRYIQTILYFTPILFAQNFYTGLFFVSLFKLKDDTFFISLFIQIMRNLLTNVMKNNSENNRVCFTGIRFKYRDAKIKVQDN